MTYATHFLPMLSLPLVSSYYILPNIAKHKTLLEFDSKAYSNDNYNINDFDNNKK